MGKKIWEVEFDGNWHKPTVIANNVKEAMKKAVSRAKPMLNCNMWDISKIELIAEED